MRRLGDRPLWITDSHLRALTRVPERVARRPKRPTSPLGLARRVFLLAALGIGVFVAASIALTGV